MSQPTALTPFRQSYSYAFKAKVFWKCGFIDRKDSEDVQNVADEDTGVLSLLAALKLGHGDAMELMEPNEIDEEDDTEVVFEL
jgi:hypothetical protein